MAKGNHKTKNKKDVILINEIPLREPRSTFQIHQSFEDLFCSEEDFKRWTLRQRKIFYMIIPRLECGTDMGFMVKLPVQEVTTKLGIKAKRGISLGETLRRELVFMKNHSSIVNNISPLCELFGLPKQLILDVAGDEEFVVLSINLGYKYYFFEVF